MDASRKETAPISAADAQNETAISTRPTEASIIVILPLISVCLFLAAAGALMSSYDYAWEEYLYFLEIPWIAVTFQALVFTCGCELLGKKLSLRSIGIELVLKGVVSAVLCSVLVYLLDSVDGHRIWTLFLGLEVTAVVAFLPIWSLKGIYLRAVACVTLSIPLLQLYYSLTYGLVMAGLPWSQKYTVWICYSYPVVIGLIKIVMQSNLHTELDERYFEAGDLLEIVSFGLADLPYRFIYFDLNGWEPALMLLTVKFSYKLYGYWVAILCRSLTAKFSLKARKARRQHPGKQFFPVPGAPKVYELPEFLAEMAMKFFMQEMMDTFDLISVLVILPVTRAASSGLGNDMTEDEFVRVIEQVILELALEVIFMSLTLFVVRRKLPDFNPVTVKCT